MRSGQISRLLGVLLVLGLTASSVRAEDMGFFRDRTGLVTSPVTGTSVIYFAGRGNVFLWSPVSPAVLAGRWRTLPEGAIVATKACFRFGPNKYNPVNGTSGGKDECVPFGSFHFDMMKEQVDGDVFGLKTCRTPPFALKPGRTSLKKLAAASGIKLGTDTINVDDLTVRAGEVLTAEKRAKMLELVTKGYSKPDTSGIVPPPCRD
jgi:hypothetical protein